LVGELDDSCGSVVVSCRYQKMVAEARGLFGNPVKKERPPLKAATKQRLLKTKKALRVLWLQ
jgi:hypothetical protein